MRGQVCLLRTGTWHVGWVSSLLMYTYVGGRNEPHKWTYKCVCPGRVRGEYSITSLLPDAANPTRSRKYNCTLYLGQCVLRKNVRVWRKVDSLLASCSCLWLRSLDTQRPVRGNNKAVLWSRFALLFHVTQSCILPTYTVNTVVVTSQAAHVRTPP